MPKKAITVVQLKRPKCELCDSVDVFLVQYRDHNKPGDPPEGMRGYLGNLIWPTIQKNACREHVEAVTAIVLQEAGLITLKQEDAPGA